MTIADTEMHETFNTVDWKSLDALSRRIGQRYGFATAALNRSDVALLGGVVHFDLSHSQSAKGDLERGNPIPFSQVHCVGNMKNGSSFSCTLLSVKPASQLPCPRLYHSASRLNEQSVIIFGGQAFNDKRKLADIWCLDFFPESPHSEEGRFAGEWNEVSPASRSTAFPPPRSKHAVSTAGNNVLIVSGGCGFEETVLGDLWVAHIEKSDMINASSKKCVVWKKVNSPIGKLPSPRRAHALSPMVSEIELMLYGGIDGNGNHLSDLWICQFVNEEKSRCVWTELVRSPHPRSGHIFFPAFGADDVKGDRLMMVFGGNQPGAARYNIDTGVWGSCAFKEGLGHTYTATELDVSFSDEKDDILVPSVLMIPDTVIRSGQSNPWLGLILPIDISEAAAVKEEAAPLLSVNLDANAPSRKAEYRGWAGHLASLPVHAADSAANLSLVPSHFSLHETLPSSPQSPFFVLDYLNRHLWRDQESPLVSVSSWTAKNPHKCHVIVSGAAACDWADLEQFKLFVNSPATAKAVTEVSDSCIIVAKTISGDRLIAFVSDTLQKHTGSLLSPVISVTTTQYAHVQATMKFIMRYTPFNTPAALEDVFGLFHDKGAGFLLIDFDGESDSKGISQKPVAAKDNAQFWCEALRALHSGRPRVEQYALTFLDGLDVSINGVKPTVDFSACLKSKILLNSSEARIGNIGTLILGKLKDKNPNVGVLVYSNGVLIRHVRGRFAYEEEEGEDELKAAVNQVTGLIDVGDSFTVVEGALSDFQEAVDNSTAWSEFVNKIEEACLVYLGRKN